MDTLPAACLVPSRHPWATLLTLLLVTVALGLGGLNTKFDPSTEHVFPEGHAAVETFNEFREVFGADEAIHVVYELRAGDVLSRPGLTLARELRAALLELPGVEQVFSVTEMPVLTTSALGLPTLGPGLPADLAAVGDEALSTWRDQVLATPFVEGGLVTQDHKAGSLVVQVERLPAGAEGAAINQELVDAIRAMTAARSDAASFSVAGSPVVKAQIMTAIVDDMVGFTGPLLLLATITAWLVLRSVRGVALVLAVLAISTVWVLGAMGHLGIPFHSMTSLVPTLVLVIGVADSLHLLVEQRVQQQALGPAATGATTIEAALGHVLGPCFLTSLTTALGFASLLSSDIRPIRDFGVGAAASALVALLVTMTLIPACAALVGAQEGEPVRAPRLDRLGAFATERRWLGCLLLPLLLGLGISGGLRIEPNTDFLGFFRPETALVRDAERIQGLFGGVAPCELIVAGPPDAAHDPAILAAMDALERELEQESLVDGCASLVDVLAAASSMGASAMVGAAPSRLPQTREDAERMEGLIQAVAGRNLPMERLVSPPGPPHPEQTWLRINVRARMVGSIEFLRLIERVEALEAKHMTPVGAALEITGTSVVFAQTADQIMLGQVQSFLWAFVTISGVMILALRSLTLGLVSILPNLVPVAAILGTMGWLGIPLNSFNSMVVSVALGLAVDDTIHVLVGFKRFSAGRTVREALRETVAHEGAAVVSTSLVLLAGFGVLLGASFRPTQHFGLLVAVSIGAALIGDLLMLPALLQVLPWRCSGAAGEDPAPAP